MEPRLALNSPFSYLKGLLDCRDEQPSAFRLHSDKVQLSEAGGWESREITCGWWRMGSQGQKSEPNPCALFSGKLRPGS